MRGVPIWPISALQLSSDPTCCFLFHRSIATNPSHLLARELDGCFIETDDLAVVISCYLPPVLVDYEAVTSLVPRLHDLSWDLLLHIG